MNLPNKITVSRIILTFIFILLMKAEGLIPKISALFVFILACITDWIDGGLARKYKAVTTFGKLMDPIADKILVISAFMSFTQTRLVAVWMVVVILIREFIVTGLRIFALAKGKVIEAHPLGKHKTVSSYVAIFLILTFLIFRETAEKLLFFSPSIDYVGGILIYALMLIVISFTLTSGINYVLRNAFLLKDTKNNGKID